ncbi:MAG: SDR family NAD(P)-dependent oxidoreductase [Pseudomonadota bacterium]
MENPVCLVTGVGPAKGTGAEIAARFARGGYRVAMLARDAERLAQLEQAVEGTTAFPCDVADTEVPLPFPDYQHWYRRTYYPTPDARWSCSTKRALSCCR